MSFDLGNIIAGFIFGILGMWFLKRAKSEGNLMYMGVGIALCIYPYFIENIYLLWAIGVGLVVLGARS